MYNEGISLAGDILDTGTEFGVITKSGNSYTFDQIKLGVGRENAKSFLKADKKLMQQIRKKIMEAAKAKEALA
jgi:recombination protein RecA